MKLKNILSEVVKIEYSNDNGFKTVPSTDKNFAGLENSISDKVKSALSKNDKFKEMFSVYDDIYDLEITKDGSSIKINLQAEKGSKKVSIGTFPMSVIGKYLSNASGLANFILMNLKV